MCVLHTTGQYTSCGNTFVISGNKTIILDPASSHILTPWDTRMTPSISWDAPGSENYTLLVVDVGQLINHGIYFNIPGNQFSNAPVRGNKNFTMARLPRFSVVAYYELFITLLNLIFLIYVHVFFLETKITSFLMVHSFCFNF